jgi:hypothetical protein
VQTGQHLKRVRKGLDIFLFEKDALQTYGAFAPETREGEIYFDADQ